MSNTTYTGWCELRAWNSQTVYGWTDDQAVVDAALDRLNAGREINIYSARPLSESEAAELGLGERDDLVFDADTRPDMTDG